MKRYAHVLFLKPGDRGGAEQEKEFTVEMRNRGIIQITDEKIEEYYQKDKKEKIGSITHVVLHNRKEVKEFRKMMEDKKWKPDIEYSITFTPKEKKFGSWLKEKK